MEKKQFIDEYSRWLEQGRAALFVGAGQGLPGGIPEQPFLLLWVSCHAATRAGQINQIMPHFKVSLFCSFLWGWFSEVDLSEIRKPQVGARALW